MLIYNGWDRKNSVSSLYRWARLGYIKVKDSDVPCRHDNCSECNGSGRKKDGTICAHMISCKCPRCNNGTL